MPHSSNNEKVPHASVILFSKSHINNTTKNANRVFNFLFIWRPQCHKTAAGFIITAAVKHAKCGEEIRGNQTRMKQLRSKKNVNTSQHSEVHDVHF